MSVILSIAFTGLCALVADGDGAPGQVLLVDTKGLGEVRGVLLPEHAPTLVIPLNELANADSSGPTRVVVGSMGSSSSEAGAHGDASVSQVPATNQLGLWDLAGTEVRIRVQGGGDRRGLQVYEPSPAGTSWPAPPPHVNDPASWRDLRFVPDMKAISGQGRIDRSLLGENGGVAVGLPSAVAARFFLDSGLVEAGMPSQEMYRNDLFEFKSEVAERTLRQALTDTIQWNLETDAGAVVIEIVPIGGGPTKRLLLAPSASAHRIFVSNLPTENARHADTLHALSDEQMAALHFGAYYKLLMEPPADAPLPDLWRPVSGRRGTGLFHTAFCPPARFTRN